MYKFADLILTLGVTVFFLGGVGLAFGFIANNSPLLPFTAILALILIGAGGVLKKRGPQK